MVERILEEVKKRLSTQGAAEVQPPLKKEEVKKEAVVMSVSGLTEFVGTAIGDTVGLVIANVDRGLHEKMGLDKKYRSIGIIGARTGAGPQLMAVDEAVKATNSEVVTVELPRDTKGGAGHGSLIIVAAEDVSDARRAVEVALKELDRTFGDVYGCDAGHLEFQYTARASYCLNKAFGAPLGKAFGIIVGAPAAIGVLMADTALKTASVDVVTYGSPTHGNSYTNEVVLTITGDSGAVRQAIISAREVGLKVMRAMGQNPVSSTKPYI
ncbi:microcompartment protein PduB [Fonticella tunisiensis]|uniref:Microcompartment protein PduB n=2 Tax=Fonticella tunisiensis TaxID=1096341 RepID=A0A4R7KCE9_9CLOT|nr:microcompartment protein PduB [Fonticella tunisiensis]